MSQWFCVERVRDNHNVIVKYILQNTESKQKIQVKPETLKEVLKTKEVEAVNLKLTSDNRIILLNDNFQTKVERANAKYKGNDLININIETATDNFIRKLFSFDSDMSNYIKTKQVNTKNTENTVSVVVRSLDNKKIEILFKYRKNIEKKTKDSYKFNIELNIIGIGELKNMTLAKKCDKFKTPTIEYTDGLLSAYYIKDLQGKLSQYIADQCVKQCQAKGISSGKIKEATNRVAETLKKSGIKTLVVGLVIVSCAGIFTGCTNPTHANKAYGSSGIVQYDNYTKYDCNYVMLTSKKTKIKTKINDKAVVISGNLFTFMSDPLKMVDSDKNVIAQASDNYHFIGQDDHAIIINGEVEAIVKGDIKLIGNSYDIYNKESTKIAKLSQDNFAGYYCEITDTNKNIIAKVDVNIILKDFTVKIYENDELSDEAILMIVSSWVSDVTADS